jgi:hypothetical protein
VLPRVTWRMFTSARWRPVIAAIDIPNPTAPAWWLL